MEVLFIPWGIESMDLLWGLVENGIEPDIYGGDITVQSYIEEENRKFTDYLKDKTYDFVITYYFVPVVSDVCRDRNIKYVAWVVDSPQIELYTDSALNYNNYIFVFDNMQYERMERRGIPHLYHHSLAVNISRIAGVQIDDEDGEAYGCDISFVGNLYEDNHYNKEMFHLSPDIKQYLDSIILKTALHWGEEYSVFGTISSCICNDLQKYVKPWEKYSIDNGYFYELYYLARKITEIDRVCILNALAENHKVDLFTGSNTIALNNVRVHGRVSYTEEAPKIFRLSKINLNITMRTIETGVPQRVFDIMGAGGFVISNYQEELEALFVPDEEIVFFKDMGELIMKINYYMTHEEERVQIAERGWRKVTEHYSYKKAIEDIILSIKKVEE